MVTWPCLQVLYELPPGVELSELPMGQVESSDDDDSGGRGSSSSSSSLAEQQLG